MGRGGHRRLRAAEAEPAMRRAAGGLLATGARPGDRVAFCLPNSVELLVAMVGALRAGFAVVPLNPALLPHERALLLADAEPAVVVDTEDWLAEIVAGPEAELDPLPRSRPMHYTSGTTGRPKGVWSGFLDETGTARLVAEEKAQWGFTDADCNLVVSPLYHSAPLRFATNTLVAGGDVVVLGRFDVGELAAAIADERPTTAFVVPTHLQRLLALDELPALDSFRLVVHAGAPCPHPVKRATIDVLGEEVVWEFYGATEGQFTACSSPEWLTRPGTVGRARPGRRLTVDDTGVLWCDVPEHARWSYWRDEERTRAAWRGGSFSVGDVGRVDEDGYVFLDGRRDDLVITGGVNVYPLEIELALEDLPGLREIAVFGVPDEQWGQRVCAAVVGDLDGPSVIAAARTRLASYKVPKDVYVVGELPRTGTGKVRRSVLARQLGLE